MPRIEITIRDDDGTVIGTQEVEIDTQSGSFHDIEGAVIDFRRQALPKIERDLLQRQQQRTAEEKRGS